MWTHFFFIRCRMSPRFRYKSSVLQFEMHSACSRLFFFLVHPFFMRKWLLFNLKCITLAASLCSFLLLQKSTKKRARQRITSPLSAGSLIELLYYCKLKISSLMSSQDRRLLEGCYKEWNRIPYPTALSKRPKHQTDYLKMCTHDSTSQPINHSTIQPLTYLLQQPVSDKLRLTAF
jgi:hypothetical protein